MTRISKKITFLEFEQEYPFGGIERILKIQKLLFSRYGSRQNTEKCPEAIIVVALQVFFDAVKC